MIGLYAATGRMGKALTDVLEIKKIPYQAFDRLNLKEFISKSSVIIDFSTVKATKDLLLFLKDNILNTPLVIGTTGLDKETLDLMKQYSQSAPVFYAQNFSVGILIQKKMAEIAAKLLDYDVEIFEAHHALKKDAPSGTSLYLGEAIANVRHQKLDDVRTCYQRHDKSPFREKGQIGFSVARGGHAIGEHTIYFFGENEELSLTHRGYSRNLYAEGAILAAQWILQNRECGLFNMDDL